MEPIEILDLDDFENRIQCGIDGCTCMAPDIKTVLNLISIIRKQREALEDIIQSYDLADDNFPERIAESLRGFFMNINKSREALALTAKAKEEK